MASMGQNAPALSDYTASTEVRVAEIGDEAHILQHNRQNLGGK
jgi:hypothetical protein